VLLVLTAVSADGAWVLQNHLQRLAGQDIDRLCVLVLSAATDDPLLTELQACAAEHGADLHYGSWISAAGAAEGAIEVAFTEFPAGGTTQIDHELVALYSDVQPDPSTAALAGLLGLERDGRGYLSEPRPGVYPTGGVSGSVGIEAGAEEALAAVEAALQHTSPDQAPVETGAAGTTQAAALRREDVEQLLYALLRLGEGGAR
jgi:heterodisulfide reductase subunit A-like polyferredoxin